MSNNLYMAEKDMHDRIEDSLREMERRNLRKSAESDTGRRSDGFLTIVVAGMADRLERAAQYLRSWLDSPTAVGRTR